MARAARNLASVVAALALTTAVLRGLEVSNPAIVALAFLTIVLLSAAALPLWIAVTASVAAMGCFNFFFLPPVGTLAIADPENWVALTAFLAVSLVASSRSSAVRAREREAVERRDAMVRLFDLGRDVLMTTSGQEALPALAHVIGRRFDLAYVAICEPSTDGWRVFEAGVLPAGLSIDALSAVYQRATEWATTDGPSQAASGHQVVTAGDRAVHLVVLRATARPVGILAVSGASVHRATLDAIGGLVALAIERAQLTAERRAAELARQGEELKSALLASLGHDLRTPLTAIRVAATNLQRPMTEDDRQDQAALVLSEVERLTRLFENILEMARIDAGAVAARAQWVHAEEIIEVARDLVAPVLARHLVTVRTDGDLLVRLDPRLTATALSHLIENAADYSPPGSEIEVEGHVLNGELILSVLDRGPGIASDEIEHLFERFYRGSVARTSPGAGMGLAIARGLLAVEGGRVWADRRSGGGAVFTIAVRGETKPIADEPPSDAVGDPAMEEGGA